MNIRLIASDLDDSLLNEKGELTPRTVQALDHARELGCQVAFVSGRMTCAMKPYLKQARITAPAISYNGAALVDPVSFRFVEETPIPRDTALAVLAFCEERGLHAQVYVDDVCYAAELNDKALAYAAATGLTPGSDVAGAGMPLSQFLIGGSTKMLIIDTAETVAKLVPVLNEKFGDVLLCASSLPTYLEMTLKEANKGRMLKKLSEHLNIPLENIAVFGDGQNDLPMLTIAGFGCCVSNAREEVKAACRHMCPSNQEEGVAQTIEKMIADGWIGGQA